MAGPFLTENGYDAPQSADFLTIIRAEYQARTGLTVDFDANEALGVLTAITADLLGDVSQGTQATYDARSRSSATGIQLADIGVIIGVPPQEETFGTAVATLAGTAGTNVLTGNVVEGGGPDDDARWNTTVDAVIGGGGTVDVAVQAQVAGQIEAGIGEINKIVTPVSGWDSVTNAAVANAGDPLESDAEYRLRQEEEVQARGSASAEAIKATLLSEFDFLDGVIVIENDGILPATIQGILMPGKSSALILVPNPLTAAQIDLVVQSYYDNLCIGIETVGAETNTVIGEDGLSKTIRWSYATTLAVTVAYVVTLETGFVIGDVDVALIAAVEAFGLTLSVADPLKINDLQGLSADIEGIFDVASLLLDGVAASIVTLATEIVSVAGGVTVVT